MKWMKNISFRTRIFLCCLIVAMIPLLISFVLMDRMFTISVKQQVHREGDLQLEKINSSLSGFLDQCNLACESVIKKGSAMQVMLDTTTDEVQKEFYIETYKQIQNVYSYAQFNIYDVGGKLRFTTNAINLNRFPLKTGVCFFLPLTKILF